MDEWYNSLSVRLYDVMEHVGASEEMRQLHQSTAIQVELTMTMVDYMDDDNISKYIFGSFIEGTTTPDLHSDIDVLTCYDNHPVHENIADARAGLSFLMVLNAHTRPGYVKLQWLHDGVPQTIYNDCCDSGYDGIICRKHFIGNSDERNGPADTYLDDLLPMDHVVSYRCSYIPRFADEWTKTKHAVNLPSRHMLDSMTSSGCFVVGVGHPASDEKHIEWRLSFSLQERNMMLGFNPTQHKCYILLKMIKNDIIGRQLGKCISSYHMKTCMFYLIQNTRPGAWIPTNLFLCLSLSLNVLLKWVRRGYCPNFFIKEENMFDRDVHRQIKEPLSNLLDRLITSGPRLLLCLDCDNINQYFVNHTRLTTPIAEVEIHQFRMLGLSYWFENCFRRSLLSCCMKNKDGISKCLQLYKQLKFAQIALILNRKPINYCRQTLFRIETLINSVLGSSYASIAFNVGVPDIKHGLLNMAETHFQHGRNCDMTASRLMFASVLFADGQYDICVRQLEEIDAELHDHMVSSCSCHVVKYIGDPSQRPYTFVNTASCVVFLPSNRNITPAPLLPEMFRSVNTPPGSRDEKNDFWFDCAAVDGKVYLHFLKYLSLTKLDQHVHKQVAVDNMERVINNDLYLAHRETAYNLLGWIQVQENRIVHSIRSFIKSWRIRPIHNAAKWHLAIAVYKHTIQNKAQLKRAMVIARIDCNT